VCVLALYLFISLYHSIVQALLVIIIYTTSILQNLKMSVKFDIRFKHNSKVLMFQLKCYVETSSNKAIQCLKSERQFILQSCVVNCYSYIGLIQQKGLTFCDIVTYKRISVAVREDFMKLFVYLFII